MPLFTEQDLKNRSKEYKTSLINNIKNFLKQDETVQKAFAEHGINLDWIEFIPIKFDNLPVSAKTDHGIIILNNNLLNNKDYKEIASYVVHESIHYLQQVFGDKGTKSSNDGNYLDNEYEQEAFQNQVKFLADNKSEDEAENYVEHLLNHHDVPNNEKEDKKDLLLDKI